MSPPNHETFSAKEAAHSLFQSVAFLRWIFPRNDDLPRLLLFLQLAFKLCQPDEIRKSHLTVLNIKLLLDSNEELSDSLPARPFEPALRPFSQRLFPNCASCSHLHSKKRGTPSP